VLRQLTASGIRSEQVHVSRNRKGANNSPQPPDCLCVDFDQTHEYRLATGGKDGYVYVLDMRRLSKPLEKLSLHAGDVRQVSWSKNDGASGLLASAGEDGHVLLWDVHKMRHSLHKQQQQQQGAAGAAAAGLGLPVPRKTQLSDALAQLSQPGLLFAHQGHIAAVDGLAWNPNR
jgi:WD40 repeat protein